MSTTETLKNIFKVIYAPVEAFKEINQNPKYIGPILVMVLFTAANVGVIYNIMSKTYIEQILPTAERLDEWTENSTLWTSESGVGITKNNIDYINGTYYGNRSIQFSVDNSKQISMQLNNVGPINCSEPDGYKSLYIRIKWTSPEDKPENATIYLFSIIPLDYFYYNLTEKISNATVNVWNNLTISLEPKKWLNNSANANWGNITGLKLELLWPNSANITSLVDGLFFGGFFKSPVENFSAYTLNFSITSLMQFIIKWVFLGGILYIMTRAFQAKTVWKPLLILTGFALITMFIQAIINIVAFSTLPTLQYPLEVIGGVQGESDAAYSKILEETWLVSEINRYVQIGIYVWTIALVAVATRLSTEFSWTKSFLIAAVAYFASLMIESFILG